MIPQHPVMWTGWLFVTKGANWQRFLTPDCNHYGQDGWGRRHKLQHPYHDCNSNASAIIAGTENKLWIAIAIVLVIAYGWALALVSRHWSSRVSRPGRMWTFVHKVATSRFPGTKASAATAETCKRYFQEAWAKREKDLWGVKRGLSEVVVVGCFSWQTPLWI